MEHRPVKVRLRHIDAGKLREAVILRDLQGLSYAEIADILAVPLGTTVYVWLQETVYKPRRNEKVS